MLVAGALLAPVPAFAETAYSPDGEWKVEYTAFARDFGIYKSVGSAARTFRRESIRRFFWEPARMAWVERPVELITIHNEFQTAWGWPTGNLAGTSAWAEGASYAEAKYVRAARTPPPGEPSRISGEAQVIVGGHRLTLTAHAP